LAAQRAIDNSQNTEVGNLKQAFDQIWAYNLIGLILIDATKVALCARYDAQEFGRSMPLDPF